MIQIERLQTLFNNVEKWGSEEKTNLIKGSDPESQYCKLMEEFGELSKNVLKKQDCKDDIGDVLVVLIIMSKQLELNLIEDFIKFIQNNSMRDVINYKGHAYNDKQLIIGLSRELSDIGYSILLNQNSKIILTDKFISAILTLITLADKVGYTLEECLEHSWNVIKDREGIMYEGAWIKSTEPVYATVCAVLGARRVHQ